jgi:S-adenosylmethionine hydrolase
LRKWYTEVQEAPEVGAKKRVVTLTTDFGTDNWFAGSMKGVICGINPGTEVIDISHDIPKHDVRKAAFILLNAYSYFPEGTVHVAVVDPGVGSERLSIAAASGNHCFVGPDNGVFSFVLGRDEGVRVVSLENRRYMLKDVSGTFHGRDVFAPVAAHLTLGVDLSELGPPLESWVRLEASRPRHLGDRELVGHIIYIDHFGNCISDVSRKDLGELSGGEVPKRVNIRIRDGVVRRISSTYADGSAGELLCLFGSSGYLEFAVNRGNANETFKLSEGGEFILKIL